MIKFKRDPAKFPAVLDMKDGSNSKARAEYDNARVLVEAGRSLDGFEFEAYKDKTVRNALREMFHGKCAYCESKIASGSDTDIEHYRPKGNVIGADDHPGYWWLAMVWENLVLSCPHCNQRRKQEFKPEDQPDGRDSPGFDGHRVVTTGKVDHFPMVDGIYVTVHTEDIKTEKPVFIDPTVSDPETLITYDFADHLNVTILGKDTDGRAKGTIDLLGLNRRWLKEARMTKMASLHLAAQSIQRHKDQLEDAQTPRETEIAISNLKFELVRLREDCKSNQPYAGLSRAFYRKQLAIIETATSGLSG